MNSQIRHRTNEYKNNARQNFIDKYDNTREPEPQPWRIYLFLRWLYGSENPTQDIQPNKDCVYIDKREVAFQTKLRTDGHTCVKELESYPVQTSWCGLAECSRV